MKFVIYGLLGGIVGFIGMYLMLSVQVEFNFLSIAFPVNVILTSLTVLLLLYVGISIIQMRKKANAAVSRDEEDEREVWLYKKFTDTNMIAIASVIFGIAASAISLITEQDPWLVISSIIVATAAFILSIAVSSVVNLFYPDRELPSISDKDYGKKLLAASDEGERHVMLEGLYRTFNTLNATLIFALFVLIVYSLFSGVSQLFAIFVISAVIIGANAQYFLLIRNRT
ncbi:DUF3169 family protein [Sporosarcina aquimarina]|uniref:DUF3169 family protein n=1 Tax=Sporosarcina aquimarina TaxID=114975 RepID=A0ABU4G233_9BACL|nr:DUF3169 family protein [Sporosarcina aquimarina]MDW0109717.1 DUF3169 family protein [Sporosarcina aquimarina]